MITTFWQWLWRGAGGGRAGWRNVLDRWILLHLAIAALMSLSISVDPYSFASKALFPAASILVGMAVAWTSRASAVLQDRAFRTRVVSETRPLEDYLYGYQLSLLVIITMVVYVAITANGGLTISFVGPYWAKWSTAFILYVLLSASIRECWSVINFSNLLALLHDRLPENPANGNS